MQNFASTDVDALRALAIVMLNSYIAIFSTTNT